jgi:transcriptional regulator with XRE-family HTH domain
MAIDELSLAAALRAWRDRLSPAAVGLPTGSGRRAAGLRREELADLAQISVDYLVRLEQGRAESPSAQVLASLARALQLTRAERDHLYRLTGLAPPHDGTIPEHIAPGMQRVLRRLGDAPTGVFTADWRLIWFNAGWVALHGNPASIAPEQRSFVRTRFPIAGEQGRLALHEVEPGDGERTDRAIVADLRRASGRYPDDPRLVTLIESRLSGNPRFAELWQEGAVASHREDRKVVHHPEAGAITVECDVLSDGDNDLKVVVYSVAPGSEDEARLQFARAIGSAVTAP